MAWWEELKLSLKLSVVNCTVETLIHEMHVWILAGSCFV